MMEWLIFHQMTLFVMRLLSHEVMNAPSHHAHLTSTILINNDGGVIPADSRTVDPVEQWLHLKSTLVSSNFLGSTRPLPSPSHVTPSQIRSFSKSADPHDKKVIHAIGSRPNDSITIQEQSRRERATHCCRYIEAAEQAENSKNDQLWPWYRRAGNVDLLQKEQSIFFNLAEIAEERKVRKVVP